MPIGKIMVNFDILIDRRPTGSLKWKDSGPNGIAMGLADMDFQPPPEIISVLKDKILKGVLGYSFVDENYYEVVVQWFKDVHKVSLNRDDIIPVNWVVPALLIFIVICGSVQHQILFIW